jgi:hypothetical protein
LLRGARETIIDCFTKAMVWNGRNRNLVMRGIKPAEHREKI